jgi:hypothetical protein
VAQVRRVVARLLQRAEDERRESFPPSPAGAHVLGDALARGGRELGRRGRRHTLGLQRRGCRHLQHLELGEEEQDGLRVGPLVDAVERLPPARREQSGDGLVGRDHQLLDQRVRLRLGLEPRSRDAAPPVEREVHLGRLDSQRAACEAAAPQLGRVLRG